MAKLRKWIPNLETEGEFQKSPPCPKNQTCEWYKGLHPNERVFFHQTLASARHCAYFKPYKNLEFIPNLDAEGTFIKPLPAPYEKIQLNKFEKLYYHQTLSTARRCGLFKPFKNLIPNDKLDFVLNSTYNHDEELFPDPIDTVLQPESKGIESWRRLRNTPDVQPPQDPVTIALLELKRKNVKEIAFERYFKNHPLIVGGVREKVHPSYVKQMTASRHCIHSIDGYTRKEGNGTFYYY